MDEGESRERVLQALKKKPEGRQINLVLYHAIEKLLEGKKLNSREFHEVHEALFKPGPCVKYKSPEKWERVLRERDGQNLLGHI